jgi:hypothetical protein
MRSRGSLIAASTRSCCPSSLVIDLSWRPRHSGLILQRDCRRRGGRSARLREHLLRLGGLMHDRAAVACSNLKSGVPVRQFVHNTSLQFSDSMEFQRRARRHWSLLAGELAIEGREADRERLRGRQREIHVHRELCHRESGDRTSPACYGTSSGPQRPNCRMMVSAALGVSPELRVATLRCARAFRTCVLGDKLEVLHGRQSDASAEVEHIRAGLCTPRAER